MAVGAKSRTIPLPISVPSIPLEMVADKMQLEKIANGSDKVAVIGSSHSAALAVMHLTQLGVRVIQFTNKKYEYAESVTAKDGTIAIKFDNTGLKGEVAKWARAHEDKIETYKSDEEHLITHLIRCSHVVFAIGLEPNNNIQIIDDKQNKHEYNSKTLKIAEGLFGLGVAYPQEIIDVFGIKEKAVGYGKF